jgi:hypothetical protein
MNNITIEGLTPKQMFLADIIWSCKTQQHLDLFIKSLPTQDLRESAQLVVSMIVLNTIDQAFSEPERLIEAGEVIRRIKG